MMMEFNLKDIKTVIGVNTTMTTGPTPSPAVVLIDDPDHRIYRGQDPSLQPLELASSLKPTPEFLQDRVEVVWFPKPGTYLVICGVQGHFVNDDMFGFVKVEEEDDDYSPPMSTSRGGRLRLGLFP
jgi:hypothetical protein